MPPPPKGARPRTRGSLVAWKATRDGMRGDRIAGASMSEDIVRWDRGRSPDVQPALSLRTKAAVKSSARGVRAASASETTAVTFYGRGGVARASASYKWNTPPHVPAIILGVLGTTEFDVDPCAPMNGGGHIPAKTKFTELDDGLKQKWGGTAFVNPPYGRGLTVKWVDYARASVKNGICQRAILLVPARTGTACMFENAFFGDGHAIFLRGRLKFGGCTQSAPFDSVLLLYGFDGATAGRLADAFGRRKRRAFLVSGRKP